MNETNHHPPQASTPLSKEGGGGALKRIVTLSLTIILGPVWYYNALSIEAIYGPQNALRYL